MTRDSFLGILIIIFFSLVWSSAFIAAVYPVRELGPYLCLSLRFFISAIILFIICKVAGLKLRKKEERQHGLVLGILNNVN